MHKAKKEIPTLKYLVDGQKVNLVIGGPPPVKHTPLQEESEINTA